MPRIPTGKPNGRPQKEIDWKIVDSMLLANCHGTEIAPHFNLHPDTFYARVEKEMGMGFTEYSQQKKQNGDALLKVKQFDKALKGDNTCLIWLGKVRLKQREATEDRTLSPNDNNLNQLIGYLKSLKKEEDASKPETDTELQRSE